MHIDWNLFSDSNSDLVAHAIYDRNRLFQMARVIAGIGADSYKFSVRGAAHPLYTDLLLFLLNIFDQMELTLYASEGQEPDFWKLLFKNAAPGQTRIVITPLHDKEGLLAWLPLIGMAADNGQTAVVNADTRWRKHLESLRQKVKFEFVGEGESFGEAGHCGWTTIGGGDCPPFRTGQICVPGASYIRIEHNGHFFNTPCAQAVDMGPLWEATPRTWQNLPAPLKCRQSSCSEPLVIRRFDNEEQAAAWIAHRPKRGSKIMPRLKRICATGQSIHDIRLNSEIQQFWPDDIEEIYDSLADAPSRDAFLRSLLAAATGQNSWLEARPCPPEILEAISRTECVEFSESGKYCGIFFPSEPVSDLNIALPTLRLHKPVISMPVNSGLLFAAPRTLIDMGYKIFWGWQGKHAGHIYAIHQLQEKRTFANAAIVSGMASVIIAAHDNADTIRRCIDSVFIQGVDNLEIVVIDNASRDDTARILAEYESLWPGHVRWRHLQENMSPAYVLNLGMGMARGEFMTFLDAHDALAPGFLEKGIRAIAAQDADIAVFDILRVFPDDLPRVCQTTPGEYTNSDALERLLPKKPAPYAACGVVYGSEFLRRNNILYSDAGAHAAMFFSARALGAARKVIALSDPGYLLFPRPCLRDHVVCGLRSLSAFGQYARLLSETYDAHGVDKGSDAFKSGIRAAYTLDAENMYGGVIRVREQKELDEAVAEIGICREALCHVLEDYAQAFTARAGRLPDLSPLDADWRAAASRPWPEIEASLIMGSTAVRNPAISVIIPSYDAGKYLESCLNSVLSQSMPDFEVIIVDDASTDGSGLIIEDYAARDGRISVYRLKENCRQGIACNLGLRKARGRYIIFVDADDICLPGYFAAAFDLMEAKGADMAVFGSCLEKEKGGVWERPAMDDGVINKAQAMEAFWEGRLQPEPWAKIFRADALQAHNAQFPAYIFHQDTPFMFQAVMASQKIATSTRVVYQRAGSKNSSLRPDKVSYLQIHSAYRFYAIMDGYLQSLRGTQYYPGDRAAEKFIRWNLENVILPKIAAFVAAGAGVPMSGADYAMLAKNRSFLRALMAGAAETCPGSRAGGGLPTPAHDPIWRPHEYAAPLATVIMRVGNDERSLGAAIQSITRQTMISLELLLIIDTGSRDSSQEICRQMARDDGRLRVLAQDECPDGGIGAAKGRYIAFARPGIILAPDFLLKSCRWLAMRPEADGALFARAENDKFTPAAGAKSAATGELGAILERGAPLPVPYGALWRRSMLAELAKEGLKPDDPVFPLAAAQRAQEIIFDSSPGWLGVVEEKPDSADFQSAFERLAWLEKHGFDTPGGEASPKLAAKVLDEFMECALPYLALFASQPASPLTKKHIDTLRSMPRAFANILTRCAALHSGAGKTGRGDAPPMPCGQMLNSGKAQDKATAPFLSVIVYCRNAYGRITPALERLLANCRGSLEILLVDDDSNDETRTELLRLVDESEMRGVQPSISLWHTPQHAGKANAWNLALERASGQYVYFAEATDLLPSWLAGIGENICPECDMALAGARGNMETILDSCFCRQAGNPVFRKNFLTDNCLKFHDIAHPRMAHIIQCLRISLRIQELPFTPVPLSPDWGTAGEEWRFEAAMRALETMAGLLAGASERLRKSWVDWLFASTNSFLDVLLSFPAFRLEDSCLRNLLRPLLLDDVFLRRLMLELALIWQGANK